MFLALDFNAIGNDYGVRQDVDHRCLEAGALYTIDAKVSAPRDLQKVSTKWFFSFCLSIANANASAKTILLMSCAIE